jgi:hypothetical protein
MNPVYPSFSQLRHDATYTTLSSLIAACLEILLCHGWANGNLAMEKSLMERLIDIQRLFDT